MVLAVAVATENNAVDGRILIELVRLSCGIAITPWASDKVNIRGGRWKVVKEARTLLLLAEKDGIRHGLLSIDNDGGSRRHPPHIPTHDIASEAADKDGCSTCMLLAQVPESWVLSTCIVVPVQTIETWLLVAQGAWPENSIPERSFDRPSLKKQFWGVLSGADQETKASFALGVLNRSGVLELLRSRPSFQAFETQVRSWRPPLPTTSQSQG